MSENTTDKKRTLSLEAQKAAVEGDASTIIHIDNPYPEVQKIAVETDADLIEYIENPTEEVQQIAVETDADLIKYIKNPSKNIQIIAVETDSDTILLIKNACDEAWEIALKDNPDLVEHFSEKHDETQNVKPIKKIEKKADSIATKNRDLLFGVLSAASFVGVFILEKNFIIAALIALLFYLGLTLLFSKKQVKKAVTGSLGVIDLSVALDDGRNKIQEIMSYIENMPKNTISSKLTNICETGSKLYTEMEKVTDPSVVTKFTRLYLDSTIQIIHQYNELMSKSNASNKPETIKLLSKFETLLTRIELDFTKQSDKFLANDMTQLSIELDTLDNLLNIEGVSTVQSEQIVAKN